MTSRSGPQASCRNVRLREKSVSGGRPCMVSRRRRGAASSRRRLALRPLTAAFRGPLEHSGCGGSNGSISERTPDGKEYQVGGTVTEEDVHAIVSAVNFVRALCSRGERSEERRVGKECRSRWAA